MLTHSLHMYGASLNIFVERGPTALFVNKNINVSLSKMISYLLTCNLRTIHFFKDDSQSQYKCHLLLQQFLFYISKDNFGQCSTHTPGTTSHFPANICRYSREMTSTKNTRQSFIRLKHRANNSIFFFSSVPLNSFRDPSRLVEHLLKKSYLSDYI